MSANDRLKGKFHGCPFHGDDFEACIGYSGTAPCTHEECDSWRRVAERLETERDALAATLEQVRQAAKAKYPEDISIELDRALATAPAAPLTRLKAQQRATALQQARNCFREAYPVDDAYALVGDVLEGFDSLIRRQTEGGQDDG